MDFYTSTWNEYINNNWKDALTKNFSVCNSKIYDGNYNDLLKQDTFNKYYNLKRKYVSMESNLEERFGKYEKVELFDREKEFKLFENRIKIIIDNEKNKLFKILELLKKYNIELDLDINDVDFNLLSLNKANRSTINFYQKLINLYHNTLFNQTKTRYYKTIIDNLKNIGTIYNNVNSFLTNRDEYMKYKQDNFYEFVKKLHLHDVIVTKYDINDKDIIIEFETGIRLKIFNSDVIITKEVEKGIFKTINLELNLDILQDVYFNTYLNFEDITKCLTIYYNIFNNNIGLYEQIKVDYIAESFEGEKFEFDDN